MYSTNDWEILAPTNSLRTYSPNQIIFKQGRQIKHSPVLDDYIDKVWEKEVKKAEKEGNTLTNGPLLRLDYITTSDENLTLGVSLTSYSEFKATCLPIYRDDFEREIRRKLSEEELANTFASATVPITIDDYIVFLKRSNKVSEFRDYLNIPSGGKWDGNPIETYEAMLRSSEQLFDRCRMIVRNEFKHQVNINEKTQRLFGIYKSLEYKDNVLSFAIDLYDEAGELKEKEPKIIGDALKYNSIDTVEFKEGTLADFLNQNSERIPASIIPAVIMAGAHKFGEDWALSINGIKKLIEP